MEPASGKEKARPGRRRIACQACASNKQKCDGATRHPCRRCELYGVACEYPDGKVPKGAVRVSATTSSGPPAPPTPLERDLGEGTSRGNLRSSIAGGAPGTRSRGEERVPHDREGQEGQATNGIGGVDLAAALREITARLQAIETGLDHDRRSGFRSSAKPTPSPSTVSLVLPPAHSPHLDPQRSSGPSSTAHSDVATNTLEQMDMPHESNPLQVLVATLDEVERLNRGENAMDEGDNSDDRASGPEGGRLTGGRDEDEPRLDEMSEAEQLAHVARNTPRSHRPDVFSRGLMSVEDVELAYAFYRQRIQPWVPIVEQRLPLVVRAKSPFLFHAILLVTDYYNTSTSLRAAEVYTGLTSIVNELVASHIFAPDPSVFNCDLVRGLLLLLYYKPVQTTFLSNRGLKTNSRIAYASKVNALSSLMIHSLIQRTASFLNLQQSPAMLQMYFENPNAAAKAKLPPYEEVLDDYRLWCSLIAADNLGSLQSGRASWADPTSALRVGRKFANLNGDPTDVRRTAILELYSIITVPPSAAAATRPVRYRLEHLSRINAELDQWRAHWSPLLIEAQQKGDPLAYTVERTLACFVLLSVNGATFSRWSLERSKEQEEGKEGRPSLTNEDWRHLQIAADAAQSAIYATSLEAQDAFKPLKGDAWPRVSGSVREPLRLSPSVAEDFKTALDTISCIAFAYSLLLLVRMSSAGLISCNIAVRQKEYESGVDLGVPQPLTTGDKLPLLLDLGANFLHAISPSVDHPAKKHAVLIQTILRVGLGEHSLNGAGSPFSPIVAQTGSHQSASPPSSTMLPGNRAPSRQHSAPHPSFAASTTNPVSTSFASSLSMPGPSTSERRAQQPLYDTWTWDQRNTSSPAPTGALKSLVMPNLIDPTAPSAASGPTSTIGSGTSNFDAIGRAGEADPAQAMASLLASSNPFLDEFYATQASLNSNTFDDFGLNPANGVGGVGDVTTDWTAFDNLGGVSGSQWMGL
ncbi:hypothetical protein JCM10212_006298 [Sporobolomyces blumeae]